MADPGTEADTGSEAPPEEGDARIPELQEAVLDAATVDQLFFDVAHGAELLDVRVKGGAEARAATAGAWSLSDAREALARGAAFAVQLRYRHAGRVWWDTLTRTPDGTRLVRVAAPALGRASP